MFIMLWITLLAHVVKGILPGEALATQYGLVIEMHSFATFHLFLFSDVRVEKKRKICWWKIHCNYISFVVIIFV
jgi:hypothetical protein